MLALLTCAVLGQNRPEPDWLPVLDAPAQLSPILKIAPPAHAGEKLILKGRVLRSDRKTAVVGVVLYFHHTDSRGIYPRPAGADPKKWDYWHGTLRGWLKTDAKGAYELRTTMPAPYPGGTEPAHVHVHGLLPGSRTGFYLSDFVFRGHRFVNEEYWRRVRQNGLDAYGGVRLTNGADGTLRGDRDLILAR